MPLLLSKDSPVGQATLHESINESAFFGACSRSTSWKDLPVLVLQKIISYLNDPTDVVHVTKTCRQWFLLNGDICVWKHLYFCQTGVKFPCDDIQTVMGKLLEIY